MVDERREWGEGRRSKGREVSGSTCQSLCRLLSGYWAFNRKEVDEVGNIFVAVFYKRFPAGCGTVIHSMHERNATANHRRGVPEMRQPAPIADNRKKKQEENKKNKKKEEHKRKDKKESNMREKGEEMQEEGE
ncbi:hypothetical protein LSTR_LSTR011994 [Laodelphax striatellus]|uniref:Uncharacterized protein n=1 Tax=Laodelphax striatellus TaxID=195883 RepID=A0A482WGH6_LAOST|nr:hypothetical protein LSTR_LSTR011994 [Laodelphax striatellus]